MRRLLVAIALIVAAGVVALVLLLDPFREAGTPLSVIEKGVPAGASDGTQSLPTSEAVNDREIVEEQAPPLESSAPKAASETFTVVVLDDETGEPVPGVEVWSAGYEEIEHATGERLGAGGSDPEAILHESGRRSIADTDGQARIERVERRVHVCARRGELFRWIVFRTGSREPAELRLRLDRRIVIRVVDTGGLPRAGVPVALVHSWNEEHENTSWRALTEGEDGVAIVHHSQRWWGKEDRGKVFIDFDFPVRESARVEVVPSAPPADPIELVLPPTGSVEVVVLDETDTPFRGAARVHLLPASEEAWSFFEARYLRNATEAELEDGETVFPHVGLGFELDVFVQALEGYQPVHERFPGPGREGEKVEVELRFDELEPTLTGRILDPDGAPLAETEVLVRCEVSLQDGEWQVKEHHGPTTDLEGRFRFALRERIHEAGRLRLRFNHPANSATKLSGEALTGVPIGAHIRELGDVRLAPTPVLVGGHVVDDLGEPVAGADCQLLAPTRGMEDVEPRNWSPTPIFPGQTDEQGAFELRGHLDPGEYALRAFERSSGLSLPQPITLGDREVLIRLTRTGTIAGSVLSP